MLDIVLYGYDRQGRLTLQERTFASHRELARFFGSAEAITWEWAEVTTDDGQGQPKIVRYVAEDLRTPSEEEREGLDTGQGQMTE